MYRVPCPGGWILRRLISLMDLCLSNTWPWFKCVCLTWTCARARACVGDCASGHLSGLTCTVTSTILQGVRCKASCSPPPRRPPGKQPSITKQPAGPQINISPAARGSAPDSSPPLMCCRQCIVGKCIAAAQSFFTLQRLVQSVTLLSPSDTQARCCPLKALAIRYKMT